MSHLSVHVRQGTGAYIPARIGAAEVVWQEPVSVITTHTGTRIRIDGTCTELITTHGSYDASDEVPAASRGDHAELVAYWTAKAEEWAGDADRLARCLVTDAGEVVEAPGFKSVAQLERYVARAKQAQLRTWPSGTAGTVMVSSGTSEAVYAVTRTRCTCQAGTTHGYCYHRAYVLWLHDVEGMPVCRVATIGTAIDGQAVPERKAA